MPLLTLEHNIFSTGADQGERWSLPTHLVDAIFFVQCRRVTTFEQSGGALDVLNRLSSAIDEGYSAKSLQRLPHVTLLDPDFYHNRLKPLLAEWAYLWLQKQQNRWGYPKFILPLKKSRKENKTRRGYYIF